MQCVILAGGLGTRVRSVSEAIPKTLLPVAGRPFADWQLDWLASSGIDSVTYCIGHLGEQVREHVADGARWGLRIAYVDEGAQLRGTAGAVALADQQGVLDDRFLVLYGDSWLQADPTAVFHAAEASGQPALMTVFENHDRWDRSNVVYRDGLVVRYEKGLAEPPDDMVWIDYGLSVLTARRADRARQPGRARRPGPDAVQPGRPGAAGGLPRGRPLLRDRLPARLGRARRAARREPVAVTASPELATGGPAAASRPAFVTSALLLLVFLASSVVAVGLVMHEYPYPSPIDEVVHFDYIHDFPHVPVNGERVSPEGLDEWACRTSGPEHRADDARLRWTLRSPASSPVRATRPPGARRPSTTA